MVSEPVFECVGRHSDILFCRLIVCGCHFSFVDHVVSHAFTRDWAFVLFVENMMKGVTRVVLTIELPVIVSALF